MPIKKRVYKQSAIERKSQGISSGVNASNKAQLRKISQIDTTKQVPQVPLVDLYMRVNKKWNFKGKSCGLCGIMMTDEKVIEKHRYICKVLSQKEKYNE